MNGFKPSLYLGPLPPQLDDVYHVKIHGLAFVLEIIIHLTHHRQRTFGSTAESWSLFSPVARDN